MTIPSPRVAVYVSSFDGYEDVWPLYFKAFFECWPDCPWPVYLGANEKRASDERVRTLCAPESLTWTQQLRQNVMQINADYILFTLDDFILKGRVDTQRLLKLADVAARLKINALKLLPVPSPRDALSGWPDIGAYAAHQQLRTSAHPTLFHKADLLSILRDDESIWQFEINGAVRAAALPLCCAVWDAAIHYEHAITQKKWFPWTVWKMQQRGYPVDLKTRGVLPWKNAIFYLIHRKSGPFLRWLFPLWMRQRLLRIVMPNKYRHS